MFSTAHIVYLIVFLTLPIILFIFLSKLDISVRKVVIVCAILGIFSELFRSTFWVAPNENGKYFLFPSLLPLHLCSIQVIIMSLIAFSNNKETRKRLIAFFIPTAFWGGFFALLIPTTLFYHGPSHVLTLNFFIYHAMIVGLAIYLFIKEFNKLSVRNYVQSLILVSILFVGSIYVNAIVAHDDPNFFFTAAPPAEGLPLLNMNNGWLMYIFTLIILGFFFITITYIPVFMRLKNGAKESE